MRKLRDVLTFSEFTLKSNDMLLADSGSWSDAWTFFRSFFQSPRRTGAQMPSGRILARVLANAVDPTVPGTVIELGSGTGPVTQALVERGIAPDRLLLIESNSEFCRLLRQRFPLCRLMQVDALALPRDLERREGRPVAAVVSCLPLMCLHPETRSRLLLDYLRLMGPNGRFIQFTYAYGSPVPLDGLPVQATASRRIWRNVWPATVWVYRGRDAAIQ